MKVLSIAALAVAVAVPQMATADPWKDESGKGRWRGGDYGWGESERKFKFRSPDGCEVERKWKKGEYEEKVKCKPGRYGRRPVTGSGGASNAAGPTSVLLGSLPTEIPLKPLNRN